MAIKVYDAALKNSAYQDSFDRYSVVFLLPYHLERKYNMRGCMIACSPSHYGSDMIIVESQEIGLGVHINSNEFYLGTKVEIEKLPIHFREWISHKEKLWNDCIQNDNSESWDKWNKD